YTTASIPSVSVTDQDPTGRLSVDYELTNLAKVYVSYSRGYRSGSFNGGVFYAPRPVKDLYAAPEHINAYEAGLKSDLFARRVRLNL
ncbi:TonB-dependent receptor domain-containing protein, partial [Vibrio parahaemolyticus]